MDQGEPSGEPRGAGTPATSGSAGIAQDYEHGAEHEKRCASRLLDRDSRNKIEAQVRAVEKIETAYRVNA